MKFVSGLESRPSLNDVSKLKDKIIFGSGEQADVSKFNDKIIIRSGEQGLFPMNGGEKETMIGQQEHERR